MSSTTTATLSRALNVPLGTAPDGSPVTWQLRRSDGTPAHGLVVGPTGSGGTTALARLARGADAAGIRVAAADITHHGPRTMHLVRPHVPLTTQAALRGDLDDGMSRIGWLEECDLTMAPSLLLVDGGASVSAEALRLLQVVRQSRTNVSVVVRIYSPLLDEFGGCDFLRARLSAYQHLILGRLRGTAAVLAAQELGHTVREDDPVRTGHGVYSDFTTSTRVAVTPSDRPL